MKILNFILVIITLSISIFAENIPTNFGLYNLKNIDKYVVLTTNKILFGVGRKEDKIYLKKIDLSTGKLIETFKLNIPKYDFINIANVHDILYLFHFKIINRKKREGKTSIFSINLKNGKVKLLFTTGKETGFAEKFIPMDDKILLTKKRGTNPYIFDIKTLKMKKIAIKDNYNIMFFDKKKNGAIVLNQSNYSTSSVSNEKGTSIIIGDGKLLDLYFCDFNKNYKLTKIGKYQPNFIDTKEKKEIPHFIIEDKQYSWIEESYNKNRYPISPSDLVGDKKLEKIYKSLNGYEKISEINLVDKTFFITKKYTENFEKELCVFNIKNPKLTKASTVSLEDIASIKKLLNKNTTVEKKRLESTILPQVFNSMFYTVDIKTTIVDSSEDGVSSSSSTESFVAVSKNDNYKILKKEKQLLTYINKKFILGKKTALKFQEALDVIFPLGYWDKKKEEYFEKNGEWFFVRGESFSKKKAVVVKVDKKGEITSIRFVKDIDKK